MAITERTPTVVRSLSPVTPALPAGTAVGDWVTIDVSLQRGSLASCPTPAGWAALSGSPYVSGATSADEAVFSFVRKYDGVWDGTMPAISWTGDGTNNGIVVARAFTGADASVFEDAPTVGTGGAGTGNGSAILGGITTVTGGAYVYHALGYNSGPTGITVPDTQDFVNLNRPSFAGGHAGTQTTAGPSGNKTYSWTAGASNGWAGFVRAIRPAGGATSHVLAANLQGVGTTPTSDLKVSRGLAGTLQGVGVLTGDLRARRGLAGTLQGVGTVFADLVVTTPVPGRGPEDYETAVGPRTSVDHQRRASLYVTVPDFPATVVPPPGSRMNAGLYLGRGASSPGIGSLYRQADSPNKTYRLDAFASPGPTPPAGNFPAGQPATLATENGSPILRSSGMPRCRVSTGAGPSFATGVDTPVTWTNEDVDSDAFFDPANPTVVLLPFTGQYLVAFGIQFQPNATGVRRAQLSRSSDGGANYTTLGGYVDRRNAVTGGQVTHAHFAGVLTGTGGWWFRLMGYQDSGGAVVINGAQLALVYLGPE